MARRSGTAAPSRPETCRVAAAARFSDAPMIESYLALYARLALDPSRSGRMRADVIADAAALAALEPAWWDLFRRSPRATPFQSPAWLLPWWQTFAPGRPATVAIWQGNRLRALAPLLCRDTGRRRRLLPIGIGVSDYLDVLLDPAEPGSRRRSRDGYRPDRRGLGRWVDRGSAPGRGGPRPADPASAGRARSSRSAPVLSCRSSSTLRGTIPPAQFRKWRMARESRCATRRWRRSDRSGELRRACRALVPPARCALGEPRRTGGPRRC